MGSKSSSSSAQNAVDRRFSVIGDTGALTGSQIESEGGDIVVNNTSTEALSALKHGLGIGGAVARDTAVQALKENTKQAKLFGDTVGTVTRTAITGNTDVATKAISTSDSAINKVGDFSLGGLQVISNLASDLAISHESNLSRVGDTVTTAFNSFKDVKETETLGLAKSVQNIALIAGLAYTVTRILK